MRTSGSEPRDKDEYVRVARNRGKVGEPGDGGTFVAISCVCIEITPIGAYIVKATAAI